MTQEKFAPVHPGEILLEEFLKPMGISQYRLSQDISVHPRRINEIVHGNRSGYVYVADFRTNTVTVIRDTKVITTFDVGWYPYGIGVNPANGWVYVSNSNDSTATILGYRE